MKGVKGENPAFPFYIKDWLTDPQLQMACFSTKGMWMDLLCLMWKNKPRGEVTGTVKQLARLLGAEISEVQAFLIDVKELEFCDIFVTCHTLSQESHRNVTLRNRRMWREDKLKRQAALRKKKQRQRDLKNGVSRSSHKDVTTAIPSPIPFPVTKVTKEIKIKNKEHSLFLSNLLLEKIKERNPKFKKPDIMKWAVHIDRLIRLNKRNPDEIKKVIEWCQDDDFWQDNVLSTAKLRKQYDQLFLKWQKATKGRYDNMWE